MSLRVVQIIGGLGQGGAEAALTRLVTNAHKDALHSHVISLQGPGVYGEELREQGIDLHCMAASSAMEGLFRLRSLQRLIDQIAPTVVHCWMYHAGLFGLLGLRRLPVILGLRSDLSVRDHAPLLTRMIIGGCRRYSQRAAAITYNSWQSQQNHEAAGFASDQSLVIPNGFDLDVFKPEEDGPARLRQQLGIKDPSTWLIGNVGRFNSVKGYGTLIDAFVRVRQAGKDAHLVLIGADLVPENDEIMAPIRSAGLVDHVSFLGPQRNVVDYLQGLDLFINASLTEAFPNVIGEAMSCGLPVIATDAGDSAHIIGDGGWIVPIGQAEALNNAILSALDTGRHALAQRGELARQRVKEFYSISGFVDAHLRLYDRVAQKTH